MKCMKCMKILTFIVVTVWMLAAAAWAGSVGDAVSVRIVTDDGRALPVYPAKTAHGVRKVYAEATRGDQYRIEVKNHLNRRVGLVIAVDGRNVISGGKSWLKNTERMYILEPYGSGEYAGWRTAQDRINRFYFTDMPDSYASAFGDESAMGVIAVAVYPEMQVCRPPMGLSRTFPGNERAHEGKLAGSAAGADAAPPASSELKRQKADRIEQALESAGTGYGRDEYSPSQIVAFRPVQQPLETIYLKYEWRSTLCRLGIVSCGNPPYRRPNRLWDHGGFAPPPMLRERS